MSLFINGFDDMMMNFNYFNPFEQSQISVGQYHDSHPFIGKLSNMLLFLNPLGDLEIRGLAEDYNIDEVLKQTVFAESMKSFLDETRVPQKGFVELSVADQFFDKVEEDKLGEAEQAPIVLPARELIAKLIESPEYYSIRDRIEQTLQPGKYEYLMKVCALITSGEGNFDGFIELSRFMIALYYIKSPLN